MSKPNYRVILTYDPERKVFMGRAPELEHCSGEGATRAEATARVEEEIDAQLANMLSHGTSPPRSVDEETFSGEIASHISRTLHRDLAYQARTEGVDLDHLVGELLAQAMEQRKQTQHRGRGGNRAAESDGIGNRHDGQGRRGGFGGRGNAAMLDDRATFIEYVRGLENGPYSGGGHHGGGHRGGGPGGGGGGGDRRRRRGRGGGGGGGGNFRHDGRPGQPNGRPQQNTAPGGSAAPAAPQGGETGGNGPSHDDGENV